MPKRFTLAEAGELIPKVEGLLRQAIALKAEYAEAESAVEGYVERVMVSGGMLLDRHEVLRTRQRREAAARSLETAIEQVQRLGCLLKDLDTGLVDFPTLLRGVEVYLCWRLGEPSITWWHGVEEGFRGRKPIDRDFRENHRGDREQ